MIDREPVSNFAVVGDAESREIGIFSGLNASFPVREPECARTVYSGRRNGFRRRHLHLRASERKDEGQAGGRRASRVVVGGEGNGDSGRNKLARIGIRVAEKVVGTRNEACDGVALRQRRQICGVEVVHVVERCGPESQKRLEIGCAELAHVGPDRKSVLFGRREDARGLLRGKSTLVAKTSTNSASFVW